MFEQKIKSINLYKTVEYYIINNGDSKKFQTDYINSWNKIKDENLWYNLDNKIIELKSYELYVEKYIISAISVLFDLIFESCDSYNSNNEIFNPQWDITADQLYDEVKEKFDKINRLLKEIN